MLADVLQAIARDRPDQNLVIFYCYFDAGSSAEDPECKALTLAGYASTKAKWALLGREWQKVLEREGVGALHMKDFAHSNGEFKSWRGDVERRKRFLGDFAKIIKKRTNRDFSVTVLLDAYRAVNASYELEERIGHPYVFAAWRCIRKAEKWMARRHPGSGALYVFEKGDHRQGELIEFLKTRGIHLTVDPIFMEKSFTDGGGIHWSHELQAADFIAYEHSKSITDLLLKEKINIRKSLDAIAYQAPLSSLPDAREYTVYGATHFELAIEQEGIPRRPNGPAYVSRAVEERAFFERILGDKWHVIRNKREH